MAHRLDAPPIEAVRAARERIRGIATATPLVPLRHPATAPRILLKLENLQPIGSFKLRGAANAMLRADRTTLARGVYTASAGNMAQGVAWCAREFGISCRVIVPEGAPEAKLQAIAALGGEAIPVPFDRWWQAMLDHGYPGIEGVFVHPFADTDVMAGNGTIALEILADEPRVDAVLVPWGGGGLACGIAAALRTESPGTKVYAVEVEGAAPLAASYAAGNAATITPTRSFIDGIGGKGVVPEMWLLARSLLAGVLTVSVAEVARALRLLATSGHVVAEGAGAAAVAAALAGVPEAGTVACIVSGGNIDAAKLAAILCGEIP